MSTAANIIDKFGGIRPMARAIGRTHSTVQGWKESGFIPARHQEAVMAAAKAAGVDLGPADFFPDETAEAA